MAKILDWNEYLDTAAEMVAEGIVMLKNENVFPLAAEELMRRLGLHAGAGLRLAFTKIGNDFWVIRLK